MLASDGLTASAMPFPELLKHLRYKDEKAGIKEMEMWKLKQK